MAKQQARRSAKLAAKPLAIRTAGVDIDERLRARVRDKLGRSLGKFARRIERVSVRFRDVNGPRGGVDQLCRIKVVLGGLPSIVAEESASSARGAFDRAAGVAERAVRRAVDRLPRRGGRGGKRPAQRGGEAEARASEPRSAARAESRNVKQNLAGLTAKLEESAQDRPSRKSTRRSIGRAKRDTGLRVRETARTTSPKARARRSQARAPARS